jgi:hypothetical protein
VANLEGGADLVVAVAEDVGFDLDGVADHALDGKAAAVDLRRHALDDDAVGGELAQALLAPGRQRRRRCDVLAFGHQQA